MTTEQVDVGPGRSILPRVSWDPCVVLREGRKARAALWQAREDFDAARRYAHSHPDNELAWVALRLALDVLGCAAAAAAAPLDSSGG